MFLIVVDFQNDFCLPGGNLYVEGANIARESIIKLLNTGMVSEVLFTVDWHPVNHCSFKENGGQWPRHCVQYSHGAAIDSRILYTCISHNIPYDVEEKGFMQDFEEYGAFEDGFYSDGEEIVICGLAGDYCVLETLKNIIHVKPKVFLDGIASIDGGEKLNNFIKENELDTISIP